MHMWLCGCWTKEVSMRRALEAIFSHKLRLLVLLVVPLVLGAATAYVLPRSYQATASLWALRRYAVIGATGPESNLQAGPASTQSDALIELLQTKDFALAVAYEANLDASLDPSTRADPQQRDTALYQDVSTNVKVFAQGYNLFIVSYTNRDPTVAQEVVQAVIHVYGQQSLEYALIEGQRLMESYQTELTDAQQAADAAAAAEAQYIAQHPELRGADLVNDPKYALLHSQTLQAQSQVANLQAQIASLRQQIAAQGSDASDLFTIIDPPVLPTRPVSRSRTLLLSGGIGLVVAVLACALYLVILTRRDRAVLTAADIHGATGQPVVLEVPRLSARTVSRSVGLRRRGRRT